MPFALTDLVGFAGAAMLMAAYFANQQRWLSSDDWRFPAVNLAGSMLILFSLFFTWNLPSIVIEVFWALISVWGLIRANAERSAS